MKLNIMTLLAMIEPRFTIEENEIKLNQFTILVRKDAEGEVLSCVNNEDPDSEIMATFHVDSQRLKIIDSRFEHGLDKILDKLKVLLKAVDYGK